MNLDTTSRTMRAHLSHPKNLDFGCAPECTGMGQNALERAGTRESSFYKNLKAMSIRGDVFYRATSTSPTPARTLYP